MRRYEGYEALQDTFWSTFQDEVGDLSAKTMKTIKKARIMGLLRSRGFTKRLANMPPGWKSPFSHCGPPAAAEDHQTS